VSLISEILLPLRKLEKSISSHNLPDFFLLKIKISLKKLKKTRRATETSLMPVTTNSAERIGSDLKTAITSFYGQLTNPDHSFLKYA